MSDHEHELTRRDFLRRAVRAGIAVSMAGGASYLLYDPVGPGPISWEEGLRLPDFSVPPVAGKTIAIVKGADRKKSLNRALELLGGVERFVGRGKRVLIKPNVAFASPPSLGATTHPDLLAELIRLCFRAGAREVGVLDNPINDPGSCFLLSGIERAARENNAGLIYPGHELFRAVSLPGGRLIRNWPFLYEPLARSDVLIGVAPLKSHHRSGASMTMKNWYGLLGGRRNIFHQDIHTIIAELAALVRPSLVILDGITIMATNGPTGGSLADLQAGNTLIASCDAVAADTWGCSLLGLQPGDLPFLEQARALGAGTTDVAALKPLVAETE